MVNSYPTISLDALSEEDCWLIFSKIAFVDKDEYQREQLTDLGRELVKRCKGSLISILISISLYMFPRISISLIFIFSIIF